jgi:Zn-dependent peptidase ImmA (M78 family)
MPTRQPEREARKILERFGATRLPIDVEALADHLGATFSYRSLDPSISGLLFRDDVHTIIGVNESHPPGRQRFTIAHEIGHLVMHRGRPILLDRSMRVNWRQDAPDDATDREEIEANAFAAALLMPDRHVRRQLGTLLRQHRVGDTDQLIHGLAKGFAVSTEAMNYRLIGLGLLRTG